MKLKVFLIITLGLFLMNVSQVQAISLSSPATPSSQEEYTVTPFPLLGMLPSCNAHGSYQDQDGFFWFGTADGVCRYDGYRLNVFRSGISNPTMMTNNDILAINENDDYYFFGSRKGLNVMDKKNFHMFSLPFEDLLQDEVRSIQVDKQGNVWIGTKIRLVKLSADLQKCERYDSKGVPVTSVNSVYIDPEGNLFVTYWNKGLFKYNEVTDRFDKVSQVGSQDNPFSIIQVSTHEYLVSTWGNGCFVVSFADKKNWKVTPLHIDGADEVAFQEIFGMTRPAGSNVIWMAGTKGLEAILLNHGKYEIRNVAQVSKSIGSIVNKISSDRQGNVWVSGSFNGLFRISHEQRPWRAYELPEISQKYGTVPEVNALYVDASENIWLCESRNGLSVILPSGKFLSYTDIPCLSPFPKLNEIGFFGHVPSAKDEVWVAPKFERKIYRIKEQNGQFNLIGQIDINAKKGGNVKVLAEDALHTVWMGTDFDVMALPQNGELQKLNLNLNDVCAIAVAPDGKVWLASASSGIRKVDARVKNHQLYINKVEEVNASNSPLPTNNMVGICYDKLHGKMWMITMEGNLLTYDFKTRKYEEYSKLFEGYIHSSVQGLCLDAKGNIWIMTNSRLLKFNVDSKRINVYSSVDGINVSSFIQNTCVLSQGSHDMYFGGKGGIVRINPDAVLYAKNAPLSPMVSDVKLNGTSIWLGDFDEDNISLDNQSKVIRLDADAQNIEIDFTTCNYNNAAKLIFAYKLEGVDKEWNYTTAEKVYAYYSSLPKGSHQLLIKATDANGEWIDKVVEYKVYRAPAFYETWWAYICYVLLALALMGYAYLRTKRRWKEREELRVTRIEKQKEEELTQSKLRYFTNVSHDFLTPITVISCIIDDMKMSASGSSSSLDRILVNLMKLKQLIQQVLDFRKMENGKMNLEVSEGDLVEFVRNICNNFFLPMAQKKNLGFELASPLQPIRAYFDADKLEKILSNLLSNAYKYTEKGKITVSLEQQGNIAIIQVKDTGKGINEKDAAHIFDRFYTVNDQRSDSNGIGLSLVHELVTLHHAGIQVDSKVGEGTTFTVTLPIDKGSYTDNELAKPKSEADKLEVQLPDGMTSEDVLQEPEEVHVDADDKRLLIVEDNDELRGLMVRIFARYHQVDSAENGEVALKKIRENEPDIIISDVMMPVMDGLQLCRQLKNDVETSHIPVILLTARNQPEDRVECYEAGADGYIAKPFELPVLKARIDNFLRLRKERQEQFRTTLVGGCSAKEVPTEKYSAVDGSVPNHNVLAADVQQQVLSASVVSESVGLNVVDKEEQVPGIDKLEMSPLDKKVFDKALSLIEEHLSDEEFNVDMMADAMFMSKSSLYRKIKSLTGLSPVEFIRNIRLKRAYQMLQKEDVTITDVAYACGFSTPRYFSTCFKNEFGVTPTEFKKQ